MNITKPGRVLTAADIVVMEELIGNALPSAYRDFLLANNGGYPQPDVVDIEGAHFKSTDIKVFMGIDRNIESENLVWNLETIEWCTENQLLPIASDSVANTFMLLLAEERHGWIYYFDATESPPRPYLVAHDFDEFINKIRELTPDELAEIEAAAL